MINRSDIKPLGRLDAFPGDFTIAIGFADTGHTAGRVRIIVNETLAAVNAVEPDYRWTCLNGATRRMVPWPGPPEEQTSLVSAAWQDHDKGAVFEHFSLMLEGVNPDGENTLNVRASLGYAEVGKAAPQNVVSVSIPRYTDLGRETARAVLVQMVERLHPLRGLAAEGDVPDVDVPYWGIPVYPDVYIPWFGEFSRESIRAPEGVSFVEAGDGVVVSVEELEDKVAMVHLMADFLDLNGLETYPKPESGTETP